VCRPKFYHSRPIDGADLIIVTLTGHSPRRRRRALHKARPGAGYLVPGDESAETISF
jgi:hypothetical protein